MFPVVCLALSGIVAINFSYDFLVVFCGWVAVRDGDGLDCALVRDYLVYKLYYSLNEFLPWTKITNIYLI